MARTVKGQAEQMSGELAGRGQDTPTRPTISQEGESAKAPKSKSDKVRMSVYLEPEVAESLERAYHARRMAGARVSRSELIEQLLREALESQVN